MQAISLSFHVVHAQVMHADVHKVVHASGHAAVYDDLGMVHAQFRICFG